MCLLGLQLWQRARNWVRIGPSPTPCRRVPTAGFGEMEVRTELEVLSKRELLARYPGMQRSPIFAHGALQSFGADGGWAMQSQNRFFDDLARVATGALGTLSGVKTEVETRLREQLERVLVGMDLVSRDEFDAVKAMAAKARSEQEDLANRVAELESKFAALSAGDIPESPTNAQGPP